MTMLAMALTMCLMSCSDNKSSDEPDSSKPQTPINDGDWQKVPATGGTIEKDSLTLTFPSGTFSEETNVAVTVVRKGELFGEFEASPFYQIMLPSKTDRAITVKIKGTMKDGDIRFVALSPSYRKSLSEDVTHSISLETTYSGGYYSLSLPATNNDDDDEEAAVTLGLVNVADEGSAGARTRSLDVIQGKVGNIEWYYDIGTWDWLTMSAANKKQFDDMKPKLNQYITDAIQKINNLGFSIQTSRKIPITLINDKEKPDAYGYFNQDCRYDEWSTIELNMLKLFSGIDETSIKQTIIHELLHYFQADYDPRSSMKKKLGGEENAICEAASVWVEQFMNAGKLNGEFIRDYLPDFIRGLEDVEAIYPIDKTNFLDKINYLKWKNQLNKNYQSHGYGMGALLYYLTSKIGEMEAFGINNNSIVEIFKLWKPNGYYTGRSFAPFKQWLRDHDSYFMDSGAYDEFLLSILSGKLIEHKDINAEGMAIGSGKAMVTFTGNQKEEKEGKCFNYGCVIDKVVIGSYKDADENYSFKGKEIVIKQLQPDVQTYAIVQDMDNNFELLKTKAVEGDSLVIDGEELDKLISEKVRKRYLWLVTTNHSGKTQSYKVSAELRDKVDGGVIITKINGIRLDGHLNAVTKGDGMDMDAYFGFYSTYYDDANFTYSQTKDRIHIETMHKSVDTYDGGEKHENQLTLSFDITGFTGSFSNCKVENLKYSSHLDWDYGGDNGYGITRVVEDEKCTLTDLPVNEANLYTNLKRWDQEGTYNGGYFSFGGQGKTKFVVKEYEHTQVWHQVKGGTTQEEYVLVESPEDEVTISIDFEYNTKGF